MCDRCPSAAPTTSVTIELWPSRRERVMQLCRACVAAMSWPTSITKTT